MIVDASVWVASLVAQDVHHNASLSWLEQRVADGDMLVIPTLAVVEVAGAVSRRTGIPSLGRRAAEQMQRTPRLRLVALDVDFSSETARIAADHGLRGADAVYVAVVHRLNLPLVTLDQEIEWRVGTIIRVIQP